MNDAQTWTLIGVFAAAFFGMATIVSTLFIHVLKAETGRLDTRFDALDRRLDGMDRDIQALMRRTFGIDRGD